MAHYVLILQTGSRNQCGYLGPYRSRSAALVDAGAIKSPGVAVKVIQSDSGPPTTPVRANYVQAVARVLAPYVVPMLVNYGGKKLTEFQKASITKRVTMLRSLSKRLTFPSNRILKRILADDDRARAAAEFLGRPENVERARQAMQTGAKSAGKK